MSKPLTTAVISAALLLAGLLVTQAFADNHEREGDTPKDLPRVVDELQRRVERLEHQLKTSEDDRKKQQQAITQITETTATLTKRFEQLDRNKFGKVEREIDEVERSVAALERRVRRLE